MHLRDHNVILFTRVISNRFICVNERKVEIFPRNVSFLISMARW